MGLSTGKRLIGSGQGAPNLFKEARVIGVANSGDIDPTQTIPSLRAFYDPNNLASMTVTGNSVSFMQNLQGDATFDLSQGTASLQPQSGVVTIGGKNVLQCINGDILQRGSISVNGWSGIDFCVGCLHQAQDTVLHRILQMNSGSPLYLDNNGFANFFAHAWVLNKGAPDTDVHSHVVWFSSTDDELFVDGISADSNTYAAVTPTNITAVNYGTQQVSGEVWVGPAIWWSDNNDTPAGIEYLESRK